MSSTSFKIKKFLVLIILLAVPGTLYYLLKEKGQNRYRPLPIFGEKQVANTFHSRFGKKIPDTIYHVIRDFKALNQNADSVKFPADSNQITVFNFFYTRCPSSCVAMNRELEKVVKQYTNNRLMRFISISLDPEYDTPEVLSAYAKQFNTNNLKWDFIAGDRDSVFSMARKDFLVDAIVDTSRTHHIVHSPMLILVDPQKRIRGYYDSSRGNDQTALLIDEIKVLITEELRNVEDR